MACRGFHQIHKKTDTTITTKITVGQLFINGTSTEKTNWKEKKYHRLPLEQSRKSFHQNKILNWSHFQPGSKSRSRCSDRRQLLGKKLQHWSDRCRRSAEPWCTTVLSNCSLSGKSPNVWLLPFRIRRLVFSIKWTTGRWPSIGTTAEEKQRSCKTTKGYLRSWKISLRSRLCISFIPGGGIVYNECQLVSKRSKQPWRSEVARCTAWAQERTTEDSDWKSHLWCSFQ